jgi:hypothetical protein
MVGPLSHFHLSLTFATFIIAKKQKNFITTNIAKKKEQQFHQYQQNKQPLLTSHH